MVALIPGAPQPCLPPLTNRDGGGADGGRLLLFGVKLRYIVVTSPSVFTRKHSSAASKMRLNEAEATKMSFRHGDAGAEMTESELSARGRK